MPIYEYQCTACQHRLEAIQKHSDVPLSDCPACGQPSLQKLVSAPAFRLSGGGWYETDFKSDKEAKRNLAGDSSKPAESKAASEKPKTDTPKTAQASGAAKAPAGTK